MTASGGASTKPTTTSTNSERVAPYHHGDLHNALVEAAAALAENGGPSAVTVRAAARHVGVTPTAAYRHFANHEQLLAAAHEQAQQSLVTAIETGLRALDPAAHPAEKLAAAGRAYLAFALGETGLFRTAFCGAERDDGPAGTPAFELLSTVLDELVAVGYTSPEDRPAAEIGAWSAVHGLASLLIEGAIGRLRDDEREFVIERTLALIAQGLATGPDADRSGD